MENQYSSYGFKNFKFIIPHLEVYSYDPAENNKYLRAATYPGAGVRYRMILTLPYSTEYNQYGEYKISVSITNKNEVAALNYTFNLFNDFPELRDTSIINQMLDNFLVWYETQNQPIWNQDTSPVAHHLWKFKLNQKHNQPPQYYLDEFMNLFYLREDPKVIPYLK